MIRILADTSRDAERINQAIGGIGHVVEVASEFTTVDTDLACLIVGCRKRLLGDRLDLLAEIERKLPWVPVILVTERDIGVARLLISVRVSALVWFADVRTQLRSRIRTTSSAGPLLHLEETVRQSVLPPAFRRALAHSLRRAARDPVRNVSELADAVGCSPVTLFQEFRRRSGGHTTFNRFLGALVILRAHQLRDSGLNWKTISGLLGFDRGTLNRKSKTWPGRTLRELERLAPDELLQEFVAEQLGPLLR